MAISPRFFFTTGQTGTQPHTWTHTLYKMSRAKYNRVETKVEN